MTTYRSLAIGDCDHYVSPYLHGVAAACAVLGIEHRAVSIRRPFADLRTAVDDLLRPTTTSTSTTASTSTKVSLLWTHMALWAPPGSPPKDAILDLLATARRRGARVLLHDGDYKVRTRHPAAIDHAFDLALLNHRHDRSAWKVPTLYWPYACLPQQRLARPADDLRCEVAFTGSVGTGGVTYSARDALIGALRRCGIGLRVFDGSPPIGNTFLRTSTLAVSANAVLGFGRPDTPGWVDTRVYQYPGAGAILLHDDAPIPDGVHLRYESESVDSVVEAVQRLRRMSPIERLLLRRWAFSYGQAHDSYVVRVRAVCTALDLPQPTHPTSQPTPPMYPP